MLAAVILTLNEYIYTADAVRSLLAGQKKPDLIFVIDNGSTPENAGLLRQALAEFPSVKLVRNEVNLGFAKGSNMGIKMALAEGAQFVLLFNNDATVAEDCVSSMYSVMECDPRIGITGPRIFFFDDPQRVWHSGGYFNRLKAGVVVPEKNRLIDQLPREGVQEVSFLTGCILLIRREVFDKVGLLDEDYFFYTEDLDYSLRVRRGGFKVVFVLGARAWHRVSPYKQDEMSAFRLYHRTRNHVLCLRKNFSLPYFIYGFSIFLTIFLPYRVAQASKAKDRSKAVGAVLGGAWKGLLSSSLRRNNVQRGG